MLGAEGHQLQHFQRFFAALFLVPNSHGPQRLLQDPTHRFGGVERAVGVLEHHLGPLAVDSQRALGVGDHAQNALGQSRLARAGLAHDAQNFAGLHRQRDIFQIFQPFFALSVIAGKVFQLHNGGISHCPTLPSVFCGWDGRRSAAWYIPPADDKRPGPPDLPPRCGPFA